VNPKYALNGGTLFTWTLALEPKSALRLPFKALAPVLKAGFGRIPADGPKYFATHQGRHLKPSIKLNWIAAV
jgi:hypothetical protein